MVLSQLYRMHTWYLIFPYAAVPEHLGEVAAAGAANVTENPTTRPTHNTVSSFFTQSDATQETGTRLRNVRDRYVSVLPVAAVPTVGWLAYRKDTDGNLFGVMQSDPGAT